MYTLVDIKKYRESAEGTDLIVSIPGMKLGSLLQRKKIQNAEIRFDDGRHISAEQRKKHTQPSVILQTGQDIRRSR